MRALVFFSFKNFASNFKAEIFRVSGPYYHYIGSAVKKLVEILVNTKNGQPFSLELRNDNSKGQNVFVCFLKLPHEENSISTFGTLHILRYKHWSYLA